MDTERQNINRNCGKFDKTQRQRYLIVFSSNSLFKLILSRPRSGRPVLCAGLGNVERIALVTHVLKILLHHRKCFVDCASAGGGT